MFHRDATIRTAAHTRTASSAAATETLSRVHHGIGVIGSPTDAMTINEYRYECATNNTQQQHNNNTTTTLVCVPGSSGIPTTDIYIYTNQ